MPSFLPSYTTLLAPIILNTIGAVNYAQFLAVLIPITLVPFILLFFWKKKPSALWAAYFLCGLQFVIFFNVFSHVSSAILLRAYSPGLLTALLVNLPFSIFFFIRNYRSKFITRRNLPLFVIGALLAHGPLLLGLLKLAGFFTDNDQ